MEIDFGGTMQYNVTMCSALILDAVEFAWIQALEKAASFFDFQLNFSFLSWNSNDSSSNFDESWPGIDADIAHFKIHFQDDSFTTSFITTIGYVEQHLRFINFVKNAIFS